MMMKSMEKRTLAEWRRIGTLEQAGDMGRVYHTDMWIHFEVFRICEAHWYVEVREDDRSGTEVEGIRVMPRGVLAWVDMDGAPIEFVFYGRGVSDSEGTR